MSSVSTAFKVHYSQKLGETHPAILGGGMHHGLWGNERPCIAVYLFSVSSSVRFRQKHTDLDDISLHLHRSILV